MMVLESLVALSKMGFHHLQIVQSIFFNLEIFQSVTDAFMDTSIFKEGIARSAIKFRMKLFEHFAKMFQNVPRKLAADLTK